MKTPLHLFTAGIALLCICCSTPEEALPDGTFSQLNITGEVAATTAHYDNQGPHDHNHPDELNSVSISGFTEGFESRGKEGYEQESVYLTNSGLWTLSHATIGTTAEDQKYHEGAVRIRQEGFAVMSFDVHHTVATLRIRHAMYDEGNTTSWQLVASYNQGFTWYAVGEEITTNSPVLNTVEYTLNETRPVRYGVLKTVDDGNELNIDNVEIILDSNSETNQPIKRDSNLTFGNPTDANASPNNYLINRSEYALSYNNSKGTANWVSWHLNSAWQGSESRCNCFEQDTALPDFFQTITEDSYSGSGFQRGHLCASSDRDATALENASTYRMPNIIPQARGHNLGPWVRLENHLRDLLDDNEVYIISGGVGTGGIGTDGYKDRIGNNLINVPESLWKVAIVLPNGVNDINRVESNTRIIAVNIPNDHDISNDWRSFQTSIDEIENLTGYDFFENIPDGIESSVEVRMSVE